MGDEIFMRTFSLNNLKRRDNFGDLGVDERTI
jgi:hypothetical protein